MRPEPNTDGWKAEFIRSSRSESEWKLVTAEGKFLCHLIFHRGEEMPAFRSGWSPLVVGLRDLTAYEIVLRSAWGGGNELN